MIYAFGTCQLDTDRFELTRDGNLRTAEPQVLQVLIHLVESRERVVSRDELITVVWGGRVVSDAAIDSRISAARQAIGDSGVTQALIRTVRGLGFRFVASVATVDADGSNLAPVDAARREPVRQVVRYCLSDGVRIAYALSGNGQALVKSASWLNHLDYDWRSPVWRPLFTRLADSHTLLRYDSRGVGLSQRDVPDITFATFVADLEAAVDAACIDRFALLGMSQGAAAAIRYATAHPERVSHLILWGGYARGPGRRGQPVDADQTRLFLALMQQGWGQDSHAFRKMFAALYFPDATSEQIGWWIELQRIATAPETAVRIRQVIHSIDVMALLPQVSVPTLVLHSRAEAVVPLAEAQLMAAAIPEARFVLLNSANHIVLPQEEEWERAVTEIEDFLQS